jgi:hypothetical protein
MNHNDPLCRGTLTKHMRRNRQKKVCVRSFDNEESTKNTLHEAHGRFSVRKTIFKRVPWPSRLFGFNITQAWATGGPCYIFKLHHTILKSIVYTLSYQCNNYYPVMNIVKCTDIY